MQYSDFVKHLFKDPNEILEQMTPEKMYLEHCGDGIGGESGEIIDAIKRHTIYNKSLDRDNVQEEVGDMLFYLQALCNFLEITFEDAIEANVEKLKERYPSGYSDFHAQRRLDKDI
jgi:NTP pyrophosphatase (non-canonical NTP hydrolase)